MSLTNVAREEVSCSITITDVDELWLLGIGLPWGLVKMLQGTKPFLLTAGEVAL